MTIDEAIEKYKLLSTKGNIMFPQRPDIAEKINMEYIQTYEWLEEYKAMKQLFNCSFIVTRQTVEEFEESVRNKTIDDFICYVKHEEAEGNIKTLEDYDRVAEKFRKRNHKG